MALLTKHLAGTELSSTSPPKSINVPELLKIRLPIFKKLTEKTVPTPGAPYPQKLRETGMMIHLFYDNY